MASAAAICGGSCCSQLPYLSRRQPVLFSLRAVAKSLTQRVVMRAGEPGKTSLGASSLSPSIPSLQAITTQAVKNLTAPTTIFGNNEAGVGESKDGKILLEMELWKDMVTVTEEMSEWIEIIRENIRSLTAGEISTSPYDTAWVALVPALDGSEAPQFPKCLEWVLENQLPDGSWGDREHFSYYDRVCNTLACVIALKTWKIGSVAVEKGVKFIHTISQGMPTEEDSHAMTRFEIVFPTLMSSAKRLELDLPYDAQVVSKISAERANKLAKIPIELLHSTPMALPHSLEGFHEELDWEKLLKLQSEDGSFLCSPASTAACLLHTKDEKALGYLNRLLARFDNTVPNVYAVDLFEHTWIVDRVERLGIDRYFEKEIKDCLDYVYKYFSSFGIGWARGAVVQDLDVTAMAFRLLRQHGYDVNEDIFRQFKGEDGDFVCSAGQPGQALTGMLNFYKTAQMQFPGDALLQAGEHFAKKFLKERHDEQCDDKWIISKAFAGEVEDALTRTWYCSLPLLETEAYLRLYGRDDMRAEESLYRVPSVNNETLLALARAEFELCQAKHQEDLITATRWSEHCEFEKLPFIRQDKYIEAIFAAACVLPRPEFSAARLVWAKSCVLITVVDDLFDGGATLPDLRKFFVAFKERKPSLMDGTPHNTRLAFNGFCTTLDAIAEEGSLAQGRDITHQLHDSWVEWVEANLQEAEWTAAAVMPSTDDYIKNAIASVSLEPIVFTTLFFLGEPVSADFVTDSEKLKLTYLINIHGRICNDVHGWKIDKSTSKPNAVLVMARDHPSWTVEEVRSNLQAKKDEYMLELVREVHRESTIPKFIKQLYFNMARTMNLFYEQTDGYVNRSVMIDVLKRILKFD